MTRAEWIETYKVLLPHKEERVFSCLPAHLTRGLLIKEFGEEIGNARYAELALPAYYDINEDELLTLL